MSDKFNEVLELSLFKATEAAELSVIDIQLAAAILMFEVVKIDGRVDRAEVAEVIEILRKQFQLESKEIGRLLEMAGDVGNENLHLESFTSRIRAQWTEEERLQLLGDFWVIAIADRTIDDRETKLIESIALLLELDTKEIQRAQRQAKQMLELNMT